jgi:predicted GIY-YIG superfamily endonuclease
MAEITYSIYCLYTDANEIYIGMSKNPRLRVHQHRYKSCNYRLRKLMENPNVVIHSQILHTDLSRDEADKLEKSLIRIYKADPEYTILNIQSGGIRGNAKTTKSQEISKIKNSKHHTDDDVLKMRRKYSQYKSKIDPKWECLKYNMGWKYFMNILKGTARQKVAGPILGKDYFNG